MSAVPPSDIGGAVCRISEARGWMTQAQVEPERDAVELSASPGPCCVSSPPAPPEARARPSP
ncbi:hypothetical protein, partial [Myxococcus sp. AB025B]|uniref:hypothetical protein n=1 Tax=Myxococcus sp. AB025B TaxID=2562794 RepID=UPI001E5517DD